MNWFTHYSHIKTQLDEITLHSGLVRQVRVIQAVLSISLVVFYVSFGHVSVQFGQFNETMSFVWLFWF